MATNNRPLKAYVRYDGSGRAVSSSLIWRKNKPKVGNWKEVQGYECCDTFQCNLSPVTLSFNIIEVNFSDQILFNLICNGNSTILSNSATPASAIAPQEYVNELNRSFGWTGTFTLNGDVINYELNGCLAQIMCPGGELTFIVANPAIP